MPSASSLQQKIDNLVQWKMYFQETQPQDQMDFLCQKILTKIIDVEN